MSDRTRALRFYGPRLLVLMFLFLLAADCIITLWSIWNDH